MQKFNIVSVLFTGRYLVLGEPRLVQRSIAVETRDLYWFEPAPEKSCSRDTGGMASTLAPKLVCHRNLSAYLCSGVF
jgi:hypothetical protein